MGSSVAIPSCGLLEMFNVLAEQSFISAASIGVTGAAVLSVASLPFKNVIGFLYISEDNQHVKISSVNFWGKREDRIISVDDWIPLLEMGPKKMDALFLSPSLTDNTRYKLFVKFGNVLNSKKMGQVLE
ncbi:Uncharacterized protein OBRU01_08990 [Operophtera brumata]|uniref:Transmembrane protein 186 n=1 Tax=Operophtera brumata TaxID=104452 RepID=A0A0L7LEC3_OPEBR|nr:Uncharacterized protein OBRU01_08990 [Operophtera brumata]